MASYTFYNEYTGRTKTVRASSFFDALRYCRTKDGWRFSDYKA